MNLLELRKKFLAVLLMSFMALGMAACSSSDDPVSDDAASDGSSSDGGSDCSMFPEGSDPREECEFAKEALSD
jgi:hypothetical protein